MRGLIFLVTSALAAVLFFFSPYSLPAPDSPPRPASISVASAQIFPGNRSPEGRILFGKDGNLWLWTAGSTGQFTEGWTWYQPAWSPDASRIAFVFPGPHFSDLYVMSASGGDFAQLTRSQSSILQDNDWVFHPTWSPDGRRIAYVSDAASSNPTLWIMNADGTGRRHLYTPASGLWPGAVDDLSWSPDGGMIAATAIGENGGQIHLVESGGGSREPLTTSPDGALDPAWSPDGEWIAYVRREGRRTTLNLVRPDGSGDRPIADQSPTRGPTWSPDGKYLAYLSAQSGTFELWMLDVADSPDGPSFRNARQVTHGLGIDATSGLSWAP